MGLVDLPWNFSSHQVALEPAGKFSCRAVHLLSFLVKVHVALGWSYFGFGVGRMGVRAGVGSRLTVLEVVLHPLSFPMFVSHGFSPRFFGCNLLLKPLSLSIHLVFREIRTSWDILDPVFSVVREDFERGLLCHAINESVVQTV